MVNEVVAPEARVLLLFCVIRCNVDVPADTGNLKFSSMLMALCEFFNVFACSCWSGVSDCLSRELPILLFDLKFWSGELLVV